MQEHQALLTSKEAAEYLGISEGTLAVWRCNKRYALPYIKVGRLIRYKLSDLENWINSRQKGEGEYV